MGKGAEAQDGKKPRPPNYAVQLGMAQRLIDRAIRMFFEEEDPLFVLAVANPGHVLLHDIAHSMLQGGNTVAVMAKRFAEAGMVTDSGKPVRQVSDLLKVLRRDANSLKHVKETPGVSDESVAATLIVAANDALTLKAQSGAMMLFAAWAVARTENLDQSKWDVAEKLFPCLHQLADPEQKRLGLARLRDTKLVERLGNMAEEVGA